jgi:uncharacterized membrane protein YdjX (TVP38/TMEM64 family)
MNAKVTPSHSALHPEVPRTGSLHPVLARGRWIKWLVVLAVLSAAAFLLYRVGWNDLVGHLHRLNPVVLLVLMAVLPVFGFSIAVVYVIAGAKFGLLWGGAAIALVTTIHLVATHALARSLLRPRIERHLLRHRGRVPHLPRGEEASFSTMVALVPGLPYFARNCALALTHIPLRTYFWICLPLYVLRSYVTLSLGDLGAELTREKLLILGGIFVVKISVCTYLILRIRRRLSGGRSEKTEATTS